MMTRTQLVAKLAEPKAPPLPRAPSIGEPEHVGSERCKPSSPWYKSLVKSGMQFFKVMSSGEAPQHVTDERNLLCEACPHVIEKPNGRHACGCCGCGSWGLADTENKNKLNGAFCPAPDAFFGPVKRKRLLSLFND